jgi:hypothetical protein
MKNQLVTGGFILLLIFGFAVFNSQKQNYPDKIKPSETTTEQSSTQKVVSPSTIVSQSTAPLLQETDIIQTFFNLIKERKISEAVMMMTSNITRDDSTKQAFGVQFAAMDSVKVNKIEESSKGDWTESKHQYMVTLDVVMNSSSANSLIPYYGFEKGENIRFINLIKEGNKWKIEGIATGP